MSESPKLIDLLSCNEHLFRGMVKKCNETYRSGHTLTTYLKIIDTHRRVYNISELVDDDKFIKLIYETLKLWNMDQRKASLESYDTFSKSIIDCKEYLGELYNIELNNVTVEKLDALKNTLFLLFRDLKIMKSGRRIVGVSKAMHFLLPDLIMPIDGKYTMEALFGYNKLSKTATDEFEDMFYILNRFHYIARRYNLNSGDCDLTGWNTSVPKLIDNAIIGFVNNMASALDYLNTKIECNMQYSKDTV